MKFRRKLLITWVSASLLSTHIWLFNQKFLITEMTNIFYRIINSHILTINNILIRQHNKKILVEHKNKSIKGNKYYIYNKKHRTKWKYKQTILIPLNRCVEKLQNKILSFFLIYFKFTWFSYIFCKKYKWKYVLFIFPLYNLLFTKWTRWFLLSKYNLF